MPAPDGSRRDSSFAGLLLASLRSPPFRTTLAWGEMKDACGIVLLMQNFALYLRTIVFGITDSLVSMVGLLAGLNAGGASREIVVLTGVVYAFVEAFSMAVGNFLSEESAEEYTAKAGVSSAVPLVAGAVMFFASVLAAFIPLAPYLLLEGGAAFSASIAGSLVFLFVAGGISARLAKLPFLRRALRMALLGGAAILIGVAVGSFLPAS